MVMRSITKHLSLKEEFEVLQAVFGEVQFTPGAHKPSSKRLIEILKRNGLGTEVVYIPSFPAVAVQKSPDALGMYWISLLTHKEGAIDCKHEVFRLQFRSLERGSAINRHEMCRKCGYSPGLPSRVKVMWAIAAALWGAFLLMHFS